MRPSIALTLQITLAGAVLSPAGALAQTLPPIERAAGACHDCTADGWSNASVSPPDVIVGDGPWPGGTYPVSDVDGGPLEGSNMCFLLMATAGAEAVAAPITGLVPGGRYAVSVWFQGARLTSPTVVWQYGDVEVEVAGVSSTYSTAAGDAWTEAVVAFTASSSTETLTIRGSGYGAGPSGGAVVIDAATVRGDTPDGATCGSDGECASLHCVDGVCCDAACTGQCEACDVSGSEGTCAPVSGAPHGSRAACSSDGTVCGGACDGTARDACAYPDASVSCRAGSCADGVAIVAASCDGAGACPAEATQICAPYVCGASACAGDCDTDDDCDASAFCSGGMCMPRLAGGAACDRARQCSSDQCVDGVCCESACSGQCEACDVAGREGRCLAVVGSPHGARAACSSDGSECGGACDGATRDACVYPAASETCGEARCEDGVATEAGACDGAGSCVEGDGAACAPYACGATECLTSCDGDEDCASGHACSGGACEASGSDAGGGNLDAGTVPDAAVTPPPDAPGCGCSAPGTSERAPGLLALCVLGWILRRRARSSLV